MKVFQIIVPLENTAFAMQLLELLDVDDYSVFEVEDGPQSEHLDENDLPMAAFNIIEFSVGDFSEAKVKALFEKSGGEVRVLDIDPHLEEEIEDLEIGSFIITSKEYSGDKTPIYMSPGMAFGTGHHQTTRGCILAMEGVKSDKVNSILDLGCGSGILAMAAQSIFKTNDIIASDIDPVAIEVAEENFKRNKSNIKGLVSEGFDNLPKDKKYDLILANILLKPLCAMNQEIIDSLNPGGHAIFAGIIKTQKDDLLKAFSDLKLVHDQQIDDWVILLMQKV